MLPGTNHVRRQFTPIAGIFAEQMARNDFFLDTYRWTQWSAASFLSKCEEQNSANKKSEVHLLIAQTPNVDIQCSNRAKPGSAMSFPATPSTPIVCTKASRSSTAHPSFPLFCPRGFRRSVKTFVRHNVFSDRATCVGMQAERLDGFYTHPLESSKN